MISTLFLCLAATVVDGDTLRCSNVPEANGRVRLARIDTPERGQSGYHAASAALHSLIEGQSVSCRWVDADPRTTRIEWHDRFGRRVAFCSVAGHDLTTALLDGGHGKRWP